MAISEEYPPIRKRFSPQIILNKGWIAFLFLLVIFIGLAFWSWRKWPDILIDVGHELYIPWQLASGKVLYRDIAFFNGPLSQYFNALIFYLFGTSFINLVYSNLAITSLLTFVIYLFFKKACDQYTAIFSSLVFLTFFGFAHFTEVGNYNWICPYSHELTHGIVLSCIMILIFQKCFIRPQPLLLVLGGICLGFIILTKIEVGLAALASAVVGITFINLIHKPSLGRAIISLFLFLGAALIPIAGCFFYLGKFMTNIEIVQHLALSARAIYEGSVVQNKFYRAVTGLNSPFGNLVLMGLGALYSFFFGGVASTVDLSKSSGVEKKRILIKLSVLLFISTLLIKFFSVLILGKSLSPINALQFAGLNYWLIIGRALPPITLVLALVLLWILIRRVRTKEIAMKLASLIMWAVFSLGLLEKILLQSHTYHYGFALAMPATVLLTAAYLWLLPGLLKRIGGKGLTARRIVTGALLADLVLALIWSNNIYSQKNFSVGRGGDRIITYQNRYSLSPPGPSIAELLKQIEYLVPKQGNFGVLPEGIIANYLTRRPNPTHYTGLTPPEMIIYGEGNILKSLSDTQPDFFVIIPRDMKEYGVGFFGEDPNYGKNIKTWIFNRYEKVWQEPDYLQADNRFKISILKRKSMDNH